MKTQIQKWGNSLAIRIPKPFASQLQLEAETPVELEVDDGRLVVRAANAPTLEELVAQITPENVHGETDWGGPVGKEVW
jgi:antitoxin MazE